MGHTHPQSRYHRRLTRLLLLLKSLHGDDFAFSLLVADDGEAAVARSETNHRPPTEQSIELRCHCGYRYS